MRPHRPHPFACCSVITDSGPPVKPFELMSARIPCTVYVCPRHPHSLLLQDVHCPDRRWTARTRSDKRLSLAVKKRYSNNLIACWREDFRLLFTAAVAYIFS